MPWHRRSLRRRPTTLRGRTRALYVFAALVLTVPPARAQGQAPAPSTDSANKVDGPSPTSGAEQKTTSGTEEKRQPPRAGLGIDYTTARYEPTGLPTFGGDTDTGVALGFAGGLARFAGGQQPYLWKLNVVASASFKNDPVFRLVQQTYFVALDVPRADDSRVRSMPAVGYIRAIDAPYFGLGNAANPAIPPGAANPAQYNQYLAQTFVVRELTRILVRRPYEIVVMPFVRYLLPREYAGTRLAADAAAQGAGGAPPVRGLRDEVLATLAAGIVVDSRDSELFPRSGTYDQIGLRYVQGFPLDGHVVYGGAGAVSAWYFPLGNASLLALRGVVDLEAGNVPFFDLYYGGAFRPLQLPGGSTGVRGVPLGLFSGLVKVVANVELRTMPLHFSLLEQKFRLGGDAFSDAGRAFSDYTFHSPRDGNGVGIHWGMGAGVYATWGDAALLRVEAAYSPDAFALHPFGPAAPLPLGVYVEDGVMF